jgi:predicted Fe-Mo cluster-binding NifX family protein
MNVALTAWENRISPVFDSATSLLIAEIKNGEILSRRYESFDPAWMSHLTDRLCRLKVNALICGAISQAPASILEASGIRLISFVGGMIDDVLASYARDGRIKPEFIMPGCASGQRRKDRRVRSTLRSCMTINGEKNMTSNEDRTGIKSPGQGNSGRGSGSCQRGTINKGSGQDRGTDKGQGKGRGCGRGLGQGRKNKS